MDWQMAHGDALTNAAVRDRITELQAEAADERRARVARAGARPLPGAFRVRLGHALEAVGAAVAGEPRLPGRAH